MRSFAPKAALALALFVALALLTGCGGSGDSSTTSQQSGASQASPQSSAKESPSGQGQKGGEASIEEFGSEAEGAEREAILATFTGYLNALADTDYETACADLSAPVQESLARLSGEGSKAKCTVLLPKLLAPGAGQVARQQAEGEVTKVRSEGDRGFVVFHAPGAALYQQTMAKEAGRWKVASVAASVLVPEL